MKSTTFVLTIILLSGFLSLEFRSHVVAQAADNPKNLILVIGDGMGLPQVSTGLYSNGNRSQLEKFPVIGLQKTYSADNLITDSAAGATAIACGKKTNNNYIGMDTQNLPCKTILEEAEEKGLATGLVVTSSIVHATPACFIAHQPSRNFYEDIAVDFLKTDVDLCIGGGKQYFDRRDNDDRNLIKELEAKGYQVLNYFKDDLLKTSPSIDKGFVFFTADNQPLPAIQGRDYLPSAVQISLDYLKQRSQVGFFIMIEASQIDWACHANQGEALVGEMKDFDNMLAKVLDFAKKDGETLVVVTADHETGGLSIVDGSVMDGLNLKFTTNGHTGTMVPVYAYGPKAELFRGVYENTSIYDKMRIALGFSVN